MNYSIITVGADFKTKLSDFGLARGVHENDCYKMAAQTPLPLKWMAPEAVLYRKFSTASDVWYVVETDEYFLNCNTETINIHFSSFLQVP